MIATDLLYKLLAEEHRKQAGIAGDAMAKLREFTPKYRLDELISAIEGKCGRGVTYRLPSKEELGISLDLMLSEEQSDTASLHAKLQAADEQSRLQKGHIALLVSTFGMSAEVREKMRSEMERLANKYVECRLKALQLEWILFGMTTMKPHETAVDAVATEFCEYPLR